jgi:putative solute:sodium symporter small subunit
MKKIDKKVADAYFKARTTSIVIYLIIGAIVSFLAVFNAESLSALTINGMPAHYYMGAQGAIVTFIILLFVNAFVSDAIDRKFGIDDSANERISSGKIVDH